MDAAIGGGNEGVGGSGWEPERPSLSEIWEETTVGWTDERAERLFQGIMDKLETRRRRRAAGADGDHLRGPGGDGDGRAGAGRLRCERPVRALVVARAPGVVADD